ncbi:36496_t:CDS:1, partial [Racocetra persica]
VGYHCFNVDIAEGEMITTGDIVEEVRRICVEGVVREAGIEDVVGEVAE